MYQRPTPPPPPTVSGVQQFLARAAAQPQSQWAMPFPGGGHLPPNSQVQVQQHVGRPQPVVPDYHQYFLAGESGMDKIISEKLPSLLASDGTRLDDASDPAPLPSAEAVLKMPVALAHHHSAVSPSPARAPSPAHGEEHLV